MLRAMSMWILASTLFLLPAQPSFVVAPTPTKSAKTVSVDQTIRRLGTSSELTLNQTSRLQTISQKFIDGDATALDTWKRFIKKNPDVDVDAAVLFVIRSAYLEYEEDLYYYSAQVSFFNQQKHILREYIANKRKEIKASPGGKDDMIPGPSLHAPKTFTEGAEPVVRGEGMLMTAAEWSEEIKRWRKLKNRADKSVETSAVKLHKEMKKRKKLYRTMKRAHADLYAAAGR